MHYREGNIGQERITCILEREKRGTNTRFTGKGSLPKTKEENRGRSAVGPRGKGAEGATKEKKNPPLLKSSKDRKKERSSRQLPREQKGVRFSSKRREGGGEVRLHLEK